MKNLIQEQKELLNQFESTKIQLALLSKKISKEYGDKIDRFLEEDYKILNMSNDALFGYYYEYSLSDDYLHVTSYDQENDPRCCSIPLKYLESPEDYIKNYLEQQEVKNKQLEAVKKRIAQKERELAEFKRLKEKYE